MANILKSAILFSLLILSASNADCGQTVFNEDRLFHVAISTSQMVYVINYGVASGRIDYIVVEVGSKEVNSHFDENLRQIVTADGMSVNLSGTHRMFCVDGESVYSIQLDLKLSDIEERPGEIKMAGLKRINNLLETNFSHVLSIIHKN